MTHIVGNFGTKDLAQKLEILLHSKQKTYSFTHLNRVDLGSGFFKEDLGLSRVHCSIIRDGSIVYLVAHQGPSRVFINSKEVPAKRRIIISSKDIVHIGKNRLDIRITKFEKPKAKELKKSQKAKVEKAPSLPKKPKQKELRKSIASSPHAWLRIMALFLDSIMAFALSSFLSVFESWRHFFQAFVEKSIPQSFLDFSGLLESTLAGVTCLFLIRLTGAILIKMSPSLFLIGVRTSDSRLKSFFREFLGLSLSPLIIPKLSSLISKRTFSEWMLKSDIASPSFKRGLLGMPLAFIFSTLIFLYLPYFSQIQLSPIEVKTIYRDTSIEGQLFKAYNLQISRDAEASLFFTKIVRKERSFLSPYLSLKTDDKEFEVRKEKSFKWGSIFKRIVWQDPFFRFQKKEVHEFFSTLNLKDTSKQYESKQVKSFIQESFSMGLASPVINLIRYGELFPGARVTLKNYLLSLLGPKFKSLYFIQSRDDLILVAKKENKLTFVPITPGVSSVFSLRGSEPLNTAFNYISSGNDFAPDRIKKFNALDIFDSLIGFKDLHKSKKRRILEDIYGYYYEKAKQIMDSGVDKSIFLNELSGIVQYFETKSEMKAGTSNEVEFDQGIVNIYDHYIDELLEIEKALKYKNKSFFNL